MLDWSMRHRWAVVALCALVVLSTIPLFMIVGKDFLPKDDQSEFEVTVKMPPGTSLEGSSETMKALEAELKTMPGVRDLLTSIGSDQRQQVDRGSILVELVKPEEREHTQDELMLMARERVARFRELTIGVQEPALIQGAGSNADLQFYLQGPDLEQLDTYAQRVKAKLSALPGVTDLDSLSIGIRPPT
jgi:HAE1 family hydrophobic/amphiphilic exporter-1